jgi:peroxiredoxin
MDFPDVGLPLAGGGTVSRADLVGRPWIVYLSRHLGCSVCQRHLRHAVETKTAIRAAGADLLVVLPTSPGRAEAWQQSNNARDVKVIGDQDCVLYCALDIGRGTPRKLLLDSQSWREAARELLHGRFPTKHRGADGFQLGADMVLDAKGRIAFIHRPSTAADRVPVEQLLTYV